MKVMKLIRAMSVLASVLAEVLHNAPRRSQ